MSNILRGKSMRRDQFQLFSVEYLRDERAEGRDLYITQWFEDWHERIFLLNSGELALVNYVHYTTCPPPPATEEAKLVGRGFAHFNLIFRESSNSIENIKNLPNIKENLMNMRYVLIERSPTTGYYKLYQGEDIENLFKNKLEDRVYPSHWIKKTAIVLGRGGRDALRTANP